MMLTPPTLSTTMMSSRIAVDDDSRIRLNTRRSHLLEHTLRAFSRAILLIDVHELIARVLR